MSALAERIIAARDAAKRHRDRPLLDVMADAANAIVGQEALLKAESAARLSCSPAHAGTSTTLWMPTSTATGGTC